ncbi:hypothetical protein FA95DRAFT_1567738 [Auriscalpium vulgare]|uniref:Uncharacterized protein n=1 Tax=Auriscalpium vulgare TaxID=40419 RepID=A0ACB8R2Y8_9AGAM|nr:hypothetical protein FA95DRAFT_1567738 [Auriscalpium vulgare]
MPLPSRTPLHYSCSPPVSPRTTSGEVTIHQLGRKEDHDGAQASKFSSSHDDRRTTKRGTRARCLRAVRGWQAAAQDAADYRSSSRSSTWS